MNIGFVSTWMERGGAYVTKNYIKALEKHHNIFVYARGGEHFPKDDAQWNKSYVTWGTRQYATNINFKHISKWIKKSKLDMIFFNEQQEIEPVFKIKKKFPNIILGTYIDYYKENTVSDFDIYDFLICNTKRHFSVFEHHPQAYYVPWGTDINLFKPHDQSSNEIIFFHSAGLSNRKGTKELIVTYLERELYRDSKLIIHIQKDFEKAYGYKISELERFNIEIIQKTVTAPGLYYLGNVYVYPTKLDGLGLTMYEALACGLPVITTNNAPMNEVVNKNVGRLIEVKEFISRFDAYYWPLSIVDEKSLYNEMLYYIQNKNLIHDFSKRARKEAVEKWNWDDRQEVILDIFNQSQNMFNHKNFTASTSIQRQAINYIGSLRLYSIYDYFQKRTHKLY